MTEKVIIEMEVTSCSKCRFLNSSDTGEDCNILRRGVQKGEWSNIDYQFEKGWRFEKCPLLHDEYLCKFCGVKVIRND